MSSTRRLTWTLLAVLVGAFGLLGFFGREVYRQAPPIPERVVVEGSARVLATRDGILDGQQAWQSMGGQQVGSIWGHGAYQAPDWTADWLHREAVALGDVLARRAHGTPLDALAAPQADAVRAAVARELRENRYDAATGTLSVSAARAEAVDLVASHYLALFGADPALATLRRDYALHEDAVHDPVRRSAMTTFFFWTAWASAARRPGSDVSYTNNWPHEPLVGNVPSAANVLWSVASIVLLLAGIGALAWWHGRRRDEAPPTPPPTDPLDAIRPTASMRAVGKFCGVVVALFVVQVLLGALTAHYTVEGDGFFGIPLGKILPYAVTRTWHLQTGVFWIATAFLAAGLFLAPAVGGREPRFQRLGVNLLFGALLLVVGGSLAGEWASVRQLFGPTTGFWFGHQGYEYVDLGRAFQVALYVGLGLWLALTVRGLWPALRGGDERRPLVLLFAGSAAAIGLFYGAGLFFGARTHLSVMEYWRWWVVHLWVEGFMEVFATAALAFVFSRMGLVRAASATRSVLASTAIFLVGGIPGTFHHLYFSGTPVSVMAVGATFSALEVVPLVFLGKEAIDTLRQERAAPWMRAYRWPLRFFAGVAFWNLVGAGLFGFLINPPIALYYAQGLNTTPVHGHTALFGVYGLLALGLVLLVLRRLTAGRVWKEGALRYAFWAMNVGLLLMVVLSLLPVGVLQAKASVERGLWWARSADFLQSGVLPTLRWLRIVGDSVFLSGVGALAWFVLGLRTGWSYRPDAPVSPSTLPSRAPEREPEPVGVGD
ncbi:MAG: nitric-oxide reductase large subunit [Planctomycetes bacterium]|nr:nitric-oxide reductase large subunit [Planctomycetota bacterium]